MHRDGAEIECTLFFADVRGSTGLAETLRPERVPATLPDRSDATAADVLVRHEAVVDKFVGDAVVGIFIPAMTGSHALQAIDAGLALLRATGNDGGAPWVPIGIGVNTGTAYVGAVGTAEHVECTGPGRRRQRHGPSRVRCRAGRDARHRGGCQGSGDRDRRPRAADARPAR